MAIVQPPSAMSAATNNPAAQAISTPINIQAPQALTQQPTPEPAPTQEDLTQSPGIPLEGPAPEQKAVEANPFDNPDMYLEQKEGQDVNPFDNPDMYLEQKTQAEAQKAMAEAQKAGAQAQAIPAETQIKAVTAMNSQKPVSPIDDIAKIAAVAVKEADIQSNERIAMLQMAGK